MERQQRAEGLRALFRPGSVAVIGASRDEQSAGHQMLRAIRDGGFDGPLFPIHPEAPTVLGLEAYPSVEAVPGPVDLAVVAVPAKAVPAVVASCARKGVRGLVVVTAGFREAGPAGAEAERQLARQVAAAGMRMVGPNCLGVADAQGRLQAVFADLRVPGGPAALLTQSGALGIALVERSLAVGLGVQAFVSMGNKVDVSGNDLLLWWEQDPSVRLILAHLESVGNPRNFLRIAGRVSRTKPILAVKGGRTAAGAKAAGSHTGAMLQPDTLVSALFHQAGVLRFDTVEEMFDAARALASQPLPQGPRVAVVTNSGGPSILFTDSLRPATLALAEFAPDTAKELARLLPAGASVANPLDMLAGATPDNLALALRIVARDPNVDAIVPLVTSLTRDDTLWSDAIVKGTRGCSKPVLAVLFGRDEQSAAFQELGRAGIPCYTFPENAARALHAMRQQALYAARPADEGRASVPRQQLPAAAAGGWLGLPAALHAVEGLGLKVPAWSVASDALEAGEAAQRIGGQVALKVDAAGLVHKSDAGAVRVGLAAHDVARAAQQAADAVRAHGHDPQAFVVQAMAPPGVDLIVGAVRDERFGPAVSVGLGGIHTEVLRDVAFRLAPIGRGTAHEMLRSLRAFPLLEGQRGQGPSDVEAALDAVLRVAAFMEEHPEVSELEVNPLRVLARGQGALAVDARVRVEARA